MSWAELGPEASEVLAKAVRAFRPEAEGSELALRVTLLRARDFAAALRAQTQDGMANNLACWAHEVAGQFVFKVESEARLEMAVILCRRLVGAAMAADGLDREDCPL